LKPWLVRLHDPLVSPLPADLKELSPGEMSAFWTDSPEGLAELSTILTQGQA
jgi:hypothetical protein